MRFLQRGFSLIEVMISLSILAIGILAIVGQMASLNTVRANDRDALAFDLMLNELQERFQGCRWEALGTDKLPWSLPRHPDAASTDRQPMVDDATVTADRDLLRMGLISKRLGIPGLKIYVEYYRGAATRDADLKVTTAGMMDGEGPDTKTQYTDLADLRKTWNDPAKRNVFRFASNVLPTAQVIEGAPLLIRIEVQANTLNKPRVLFLGRRQ